MAIVLGIDCGTQSLKVLVYDSADKKVLTVAGASYGLACSADGSREQEAAWWIDALKTSLAQVDKGLKARVDGIGVSAQQQGFVPMTKAGEVLRPVKLWCDTTTSRECGAIMDVLGGSEKAIRDTGNRILPGYTATKILQLKEKWPEIYGRMETFLLPHDYINYWLTGAFAMEFGDASATGLIDIARRTWHAGVLEAIDRDRDWGSTLPRLAEPGKPIGTLTREAGEALGMAAGIPVAAGGGDNMMAAIGLGAVADDVFAISMGTSGTLYRTSSSPFLDSKGRIEAYCSSVGSWFPLVSTMNCTFAHEKIRNLFDADRAEFSALAEQAPIGCDGIVILPYLNGERTPNYPNGKGVIAGLNALNLTKPNIARASMESAVYALRLGAEAFEALGSPAGAVRMTGGGAASAFWRQMVSDVFGVSVSVPEVRESAAFGAALDALWTLAGGGIDEIVAEHVRFDDAMAARPRAEAFDAYRLPYSTFKAYVDCLEPIFR